MEMPEVSFLRLIHLQMIRYIKGLAASVTSMFWNYNTPQCIKSLARHHFYVLRV
jgi:hypothetical protein